MGFLSGLSLKAIFYGLIILAVIGFIYALRGDIKKYTVDKVFTDESKAELDRRDTTIENLKQQLADRDKAVEDLASQNSTLQNTASSLASDVEAVRASSQEKLDHQIWESQNSILDLQRQTQEAHAQAVAATRAIVDNKANASVACSMPTKSSTIDKINGMFAQGFHTIISSSERPEVLNRIDKAAGNKTPPSNDKVLQDGPVAPVLSRTISSIATMAIPPAVIK